MSLYLGEKLIAGTTGSKGGMDLPVGTILAYGGTSAPEGFLICDGSEISRTEYSDLFSILGTAYGAGNGETTFLFPISLFSFTKN